MFFEGSKLDVKDPLSMNITTEEFKQELNLLLKNEKWHKLGTADDQAV